MLLVRQADILASSLKMSYPQWPNLLSLISCGKISKGLLVNTQSLDSPGTKLFRWSQAHKNQRSLSLNIELNGTAKRQKKVLHLLNQPSSYPFSPLTLKMLALIQQTLAVTIP